MRKALNIEKDITIVCVGSTDEPADCVACCGTHPSTAGQVGMVKIYKVENNKGMFRIYFEAGQRAFFQIPAPARHHYGFGEQPFCRRRRPTPKIQISAGKNSHARNKLHFLTKEVLRREAADLNSLLEAASGIIPPRRYSILSADDLAALCRDISPHAKEIAFLIHQPTNTVFLCSDGHIDCGRLVRENAHIYGGKGGGNKTLARAIFFQG